MCSIQSENTCESEQSYVCCNYPPPLIYSIIFSHCHNVTFLVPQCIVWVYKQSAYCYIFLPAPSYVFCPSVVEQCICNRIQADDMVLEWVAYSTTKNGLKLTMDTLEQFEHEVTGTS